MTSHDQDLLERLQAPGRLFKGGDQTSPIRPQPLDFASDWGGDQWTTSGRTDTTVIRFFVPGKPQGKGRPRAAKRGKFVRMYTPEATVNYESTVRLFASQAMAGRPPMTGPMMVVMSIMLPIPASWSKRKRAQAIAGQVLPTTKPDTDNVIKAVYDAINGVVWVDDVQVVDEHTTKRYGVQPGVIFNAAPVEIR